MQKGITNDVVVSTGNHMFGRAIWDKLPECLFETWAISKFSKVMFENEEEMLRDIPDLESEESADQRRNQEGKELKILTPQQMLSRPPISLAQLKAGNNSQKT